MNRIPFIAGLIALMAMLGCAPKNEPTAAPAAETIPDTPVPEGILSTNYMDAATALAEDDFDKAKVSLTALARETTGELQARAQAAADTGQIAAMREAFKALSAIAVRMQLPPDYAVAYCPMYKGGAKWVQKKDTLANPYFGRTMSTCGRFET